MTLQRRHIPLAATFAVLAVLWLVAALTLDRFLTPLNVANILRNSAFLGVIGIGMTFVILSGGIDLSVGTMVGFSTILLARLIGVDGTHPLPAIAAVLAAGLGFGALLGSVIHLYGLPPFLVTLSGMFLAKGLAFVVLPQSQKIDHTWFGELAGFKIKLFGNAPITAGVLVFAALALFGLYLANATRFGRNVYAVGGSEKSAVLMGLPVGRTKIGVYALSGFCAALGGVLWALNSKSGNPAIGLGTELDAIACVVIGGTLLTGGVGGVVGTVGGLLVYGTITTMIRFAGFDSSYARIALGLLLLAFILLQTFIMRTAHRQQSTSQP